MTDKLEFMLRRQARFDRSLRQLRDLEYTDAGPWIDRLCTAMAQEVGELRDESNWKWWKNPAGINRDAVLEEMIDIMHFWLSLANKMDFSANDLFQAYLKKNKENFRRQQEVEGYAVVQHDLWRWNADEKTREIEPSANDDESDVRDVQPSNVLAWGSNETH